jgi:hypothetical protein
VAGLRGPRLEGCLAARSPTARVGPNPLPASHTARQSHQLFDPLSGLGRDHLPFRLKGGGALCWRGGGIVQGFAARRPVRFFSSFPFSMAFTRAVAPPARQLHSPPITLFTFSLCAGRYCPPFALDHTRPHPPSFRFTSAEIALGALGAPWHAGCHPRGADLIDSRRRHTTCLGPSAPPAFLPCPAHSGCSGCVPSPPAGCAPHLSPRSEPLFGRLLLPSRQPYLPPPND